MQGGMQFKMTGFRADSSTTFWVLSRSDKFDPNPSVLNPTNVIKRTREIQMLTSTSGVLSQFAQKQFSQISSNEGSLGLGANRGLFQLILCPMNNTIRVQFKGKGSIAKFREHQKIIQIQFYKVYVSMRAMPKQIAESGMTSWPALPMKGTVKQERPSMLSPMAANIQLCCGYRFSSITVT